MNATDLATAITQTRMQLASLATAINARSDPTTKAYSLDTSQSIQRWEGMTILDLIAAQRALRNELASLCARQSGSGATLGVPAW